jgi:hypothetical protein
MEKIRYKGAFWESEGKNVLKLNHEFRCTLNLFLMCTVAGYLLNKMKYILGNIGHSN